MEIKFRAYHKENKKMYEVFSFCDEFVKVVEETGSVLKLPRIEFEPLMQKWNPSSGLECYSGDLFNAICSPSGSNKKIERICKIGFNGRGMDVAVWYKGQWWAYGSMNFTTFKKIGNIYDNQNLLQ